MRDDGFKYIGKYHAQRMGVTGGERGTVGAGKRIIAV